MASFALSKVEISQGAHRSPAFSLIFAAAWS